MRGFIMSAALGTMIAAFAGSAPAGQGANIVCVGAGPGCLPTIEAGIAAARDGDTVRLDRGTFRGGVTIDKSVRVEGAGADATKIEGGGPVITIAVGAQKALTVTIAAVTITGGATSTNPTGRCGADVPTCGPGYLRATALGGGIEIAPGASAGGATVTIRSSVITGNRAQPSTTVPSVVARCPGGPCPFAQAGGGGIDNWGALTLVDTTVSDNVAGGGVTAQADGGGILDESGSRLSLVNSTVKGNRASVSAPNGRFANGGGIYEFGGRILDIRGSTVSANRAEGAFAAPASVDVNVACAGICIEEGTVATIRGSTIGGNVVAGSNSKGNGVFCGAGISTGEGGSFLLAGSTVSNNRVIASARSTAPTPGPFLACSAGMDLFAGKVTINNSRVVGNVAQATTAAGAALVVGGAISPVSANAVITASVFSGNRGVATSSKGSATVLGGAIANGWRLVVRQTRVSGNVASARARGHTARGGGIYNGKIPDLDHLGNLTLVKSVVSRNRPDQCYACR
ncbi:MAG: hypothetical protein ACM3QU_03900 [Verrucomicrobiota bacterium]